MSVLPIREVDPLTFAMQSAVDSETNPRVWPYAVMKASFRHWARPSLLSVLFESAMLLLHFEHRRGRPFRANDRFVAAPPHLARSLTESVGLAVAVEMAQHYQWTPAWPLLNIDDAVHDPLRFGFLTAFLPNGVRPDFVFETPTGLIAAEARGRSSCTISGGVTAEQRNRAVALHQWATMVGGRLAAPTPVQWFMSWLSFDDERSRLDFFDPGQSIDLDEDRRRLLRNQERAQYDALYSTAVDDGLRVFKVGRTRVASVGQSVGAAEGAAATWLHLFVTDGAAIRVRAVDEDTRGGGVYGNTRFMATVCTGWGGERQTFGYAEELVRRALLREP